MTPHQKAAATRLGISAEEYAARIDAGQRWCTSCKGWLMLSDFSANRCERDGLARNCRGCQARYHRRWMENKPGAMEAKRAAQRAYYARHRREIALRTSAKRWAAKDAAEAVR